jgi:hypothetical protein
MHITLKKLTEVENCIMSEIAEMIFNVIIEKGMPAQEIA